MTNRFDARAMFLGIRLTVALLVGAFVATLFPFMR